MSDGNLWRTAVGGNGSVNVRQRPSLLLMKLILRASEATLELGLANLKKQLNATSQWLKRLGAARVEFGEPHFAEHTSKDPMARMRAVTAKALGQRPADPSTAGRDQTVHVVLTAVWEVAATSAEETLTLLDRLRFEVTEDDAVAEAADEAPLEPTPEEQLREIMTHLHQPPADDGVPQFLFITRLSEEQLEKATAEAFSRARQNAERLARSAGLRLGKLSMVHSGGGVMNVDRADKLMEQQRCGVLLSGSTYELGEYEIVSDDPRAAEFTVAVNVNYSVE